jgi:selenoprotein W-related protein
MTPSHGGVFEVTADGRLVFSKKALGRFPNAGEVVELLRSQASS